MLGKLIHGNIPSRKPCSIFTTQHLYSTTVQPPSCRKFYAASVIPGIAMEPYKALYSTVAPYHGSLAI